MIRVELLVDLLVRDAHDAPPQHLFAVFVELHAQLVNYRRCWLSVECTTIVLLELHHALSFEFASVDLRQLGLSGWITFSLLADCNRVCDDLFFARVFKTFIHLFSVLRVFEILNLLFYLLKFEQVSLVDR